MQLSLLAIKFVFSAKILLYFIVGLVVDLRRFCRNSFVAKFWKPMLLIRDGTLRTKLWNLYSRIFWFEAYRE